MFGVTPELVTKFDFTNTHLLLADVLKASAECGAVAVPCHPGRPRVGMFAHVDNLGVPPGVRIVETRNGGSRDNEDDISMAMANKLGYLGIGGSDSHIVSHVGRCATRFPDNISNEAELVAALRSEQFEAISLKQSA